MAVFSRSETSAILEGRGVHRASQYRVAVEHSERPVAGAEHRLFRLPRASHDRMRLGWTETDARPSVCASVESKMAPKSYRGLGCR